MTLTATSRKGIVREMLILSPRQCWGTRSQPSCPLGPALPVKVTGPGYLGTLETSVSDSLVPSSSLPLPLDTSISRRQSNTGALRYGDKSGRGRDCPLVSSGSEDQIRRPVGVLELGLASACWTRGSWGSRRLGTSSWLLLC